MRRDPSSLRPTFFLLALSLIGAALAAPGRFAQSQQLTTREKHFGFQMGTDRKMVRWDGPVLRGKG